MYRLQFCLLFSFVITLLSEICDSFEENGHVCKNRNQLEQRDNVEKVDFNSPREIIDEPLDTLKKAEKGKILDRCLLKNPLFPESINQRTRRSTILSRLRSRSNPILLPELSKIFKRRKIIPKRAERVKKEYPNYYYVPIFENDEFSSEEDGSVSSDYSPESKSRLNTKKDHETDLENYGKEYDPNYNLRNTANSKVTSSSEKKYRFDEEKYEERYYQFPQTERSEEVSEEQIKSKVHEKEIDDTFNSRVGKTHDYAQSDYLKKEKNTLESSDDKRSVIKSDDSVGTDLKNLDLGFKVSDKVVEGNRNVDAIIYDITNDLINMKHTLIDSLVENKAISNTAADSAHKFIDEKSQLIDTVRLGNFMATTFSKGNTKNGILALNRLNIPHEETNKPSNEGNNPSREENIPLMGENIPIPEKNNSIQEKNIPIQQENIAIQEESIPIQQENIPIQGENILIQEENIPIQEEIAPIHEENLFIQEENIPRQEIYAYYFPESETSQVSTENSGLRDFKSDTRNYEIMESAVQKMQVEFGKIIEGATEGNQIRNNYNTESEIVDLASKTLEDVISSISGNIPKGYFPGSSQREIENNFCDTRSNSGFDYVDVPEISKSLVYEEPFYNDFRERYERCPKSNSEEDICLLGNKDKQIEIDNNKRFKRKSDNNELKGREIILRPEYFFYDSTLYHVQDMQSRRRTASYLRDDNKLHNLNIYSNNRFINLNDNCSAETYNMNPDCQRLDLHIRTPKGASSVPLRSVKDYLSHGHDLAIDMHDRAKSLAAEGLHPRPNTPSMLQFLNNKVTDKQVELNKESELTLIGTKIMQKRLRDEYGVTQSAFPDLLRHQGFRVSANDICRKRRNNGCSTLEKYRNIDGSCNNLNFPTWGQSNTPFFRLLPPRYADGIHSMPISVTGAELPNPRFLSSRIFSRQNTTEPLYTLAVMQWGQILAHDFAFQAMDQTENGIECCAPDGDPLPEALRHHSCAPIIIPSNDKFYASFGQRCMNFVRSMTVANEDCTLGAANQLNGATSFLDLSPLYGNDKDKSDSLRLFLGGRLKVEMRNGRHMMPTMRKKSLFCDVITPSDVCYKTGDVRTNQNPQLIVLQTLLLREHNRIADSLSSINPHWDDEKIFQEARRILIAVYQHITYKEWLPIVIGSKYCRHHGFICLDPEMSYDYDYRVNPATINGFTASAFRYLHTIVEGELKLFTPNYDVSETLRLSNHYLRPEVVEPNNNFEALLRGLIYQPIQRPDACFNEELTEYLFRSKSEYGLDLEAIDIQRGRDHGIPGYNAYRKICHLEPAANFYDLINEISWNNIEKLRKTYEHVDDIDLLVGASLEIRLPGSLLGPTLRCLIGEQFYRSRVGDKYFYDNADFPHSFSPEQFREIQKASLSRLICDSGASISQLQLNSFKVEGQRNPSTSCEYLPSINLNMWREEEKENEDYV